MKYYKPYKRQARCRVCKALSSDLVKGVCYGCRNKKPKANNPVGYNKHRKNPSPLVPEVVVPATREDLTAAYRAYWASKIEYTKKAAKFYRIEAEFLGLKKIKEEIERRLLK